MDDTDAARKSGRHYVLGRCKGSAQEAGKVHACSKTSLYSWTLLILKQSKLSLER